MLFFEIKSYTDLKRFWALSYVAQKGKLQTAWEERLISITWGLLWRVSSILLCQPRKRQREFFSHNSNRTYGTGNYNSNHRTRIRCRLLITAKQEGHRTAGLHLMLISVEWHGTALNWQEQISIRVEKSVTGLVRLVPTYRGQGSGEHWLNLWHMKCRVDHHGLGEWQMDRRSVDNGTDLKGANELGRHLLGYGP